MNVLGSFIIGYMFMLFQNTTEPLYRALVITGFLGALTTFSTFSLENILLIQNGELLKMALNTLLSLFLTLGSTLLSINLFKFIQQNQ